MDQTILALAVERADRSLASGDPDTHPTLADLLALTAVLGRRFTRREGAAYSRLFALAVKEGAS